MGTCRAARRLLGACVPGSFAAELGVREHEATEAPTGRDEVLQIGQGADRAVVQRRADAHAFGLVQSDRLLAQRIVVGNLPTAAAAGNQFGPYPSETYCSVMLSIIAAGSSRRTDDLAGTSMPLPGATHARRKRCPSSASTFRIGPA